MSKNNSKNSRNNETQLGISLKFHHSQILSDMSLESALITMIRVWKSCQNTPSESLKIDLGDTDDTIIESFKNINEMIYR